MSDRWEWLSPWKIDIGRLLEHRICNLDPNARLSSTHEVIGNAFAREKPLEQGDVFSAKKTGNGNSVACICEEATFTPLPPAFEYSL